MLKNYFKIAFRNIFRHKFYSFINIFGLTIGISVSLLISFYVFDELSYDTFHEDAERIYQVHMKGVLQGKPFTGAYSCSPFAAASVEEVPGIEEAVRINLWRDVVLRYEDKIYTEKKVLVADSNFFQFFTFKLKEGNPNDILNEVNQIVLTETSAKKYFGYEAGKGESPLGKMVQFGTDKTNCEVVGIVEDPPTNSHFIFDMIYSMVSWDTSRRPDWTSNNLHTYVKLSDMADPVVVQESVSKMSDEHVGPEIMKYIGVTLEEWRAAGGDYGYYIQPMLDIHLYSVADGQIEPPGDIAYVYLLSAISIFIILIACINFMNLATARSAGRAKEVGIRKTVGATKRKLITQFLLESILLSIISTALAIIVLWLSLPYLNQMTGKSIGIEYILSGNALISIAVIMVLVGVLAGSYPAFYLTSFQPGIVLKGSLSKGAKGSWIRSTLVVFQFAISISLIVSTMIIYKQLKLVQEKNLGFDKENVLIIDNTRVLGDNKQVFRDKLNTLSGVKESTITNYVPPHVYSNSVFFPDGIKDDGILFYQVNCDQNYQDAVGFEMYSGRFFSEDFPSDSSAVVINRKGMEALGWTSHEGHRIAEPNRDGSLLFHDVVGVVEDFNFSSLHNEIEPLIFSLADWGGLIAVRLEGGNVNNMILEIEGIWKEMAPGEPFDYSFLDENFDAMFQSEQELGDIFIIFTSLAIFIACLGLFGLATFMAEQRSKEIGIRKAMGADVSTVVLLLTKEFTKLVLISVVFAIPAVIFLMNWWLESFAYKTDLGIMSFVIGGFGALVISWLTVSYQSIRAAIANPTKALRYE
jgi:putative ABC transport system permease protein